MKLAQIREMVATGQHNLPLPRYIVGKRLIIVRAPSKCCQANELLVRSRDGGFITRDCLQCGTSADYVHPDQIPNLDCEACLKFKRANTVEPLRKYRNYWYRCTECGREWEIASIVPDWSEAFEYSGLAAPGDSAYFRVSPGTYAMSKPSDPDRR